MKAPAATYEGKPCKVCGGTTRRVRSGGGCYPCSLKWYKKSKTAARRASGVRPRQYGVTAFDSRYTKHPSGCWVWQWGTDKDGYGVFQPSRTGAYRNKSGRAHRFAYERVNGPIPPGLVVRHLCDNPPCVNPAHLALGTYSDNAIDRTKAGRGRNQKLTPEDVVRARTLPRDARGRRVGVSELAAALGVSSHTLSAAIYGRSWRHL